MYYTNAAKQELENGKPIKDIEVDFRLTTLKPRHAQWIVNMYNFFTSAKGIPIITKGWKKAGVIGLLDGTTVFQPEDPFKLYYMYQ